MFFSIGFNGLPFEPVEKQIIYIENEYNEEVNHYIQSNYALIRSYFELQGYEFCYLPYLAKDLTSTGAINYYAPYSEKTNILDFKSDFLLQFMVNPQNRTKIPPSFIYYASNCKGTGDIVYQGISVDSGYFEKNDYSATLSAIKKDISRYNYSPSISFRVVKDEEYDDCDDCIDDSIIEKFVKAEDIDNHTRKLLQEFEQQVEVLKKRGISAYILEQIINEPPKLSSLVITTDYRILLPAYDKEIQMTPLVKAVYLLFLRHPEGIIFKHLMDYRDELKEIYKKIKGSRWILSQISSINDVTNPMKNSINEKCARIKGAFITEFDERIAQYYIITGERGEPKRITLPQELVKWEQ